MVAAYKAFGRSVAPDATFTLRLAFGVVKGYRVDGVDLRFCTTFGEMFEKAQQLGYSVTEIGVNHYYREVGLTTVKPKLIFGTIREMIWFYLRMRAKDRVRLRPEDY